MTLRWIWAGVMLVAVLLHVAIGKVPYRKALDPMFTLRFIRRDIEPIRFWAAIGLGLAVTVFVWIEGSNSE